MRTSDGRSGGSNEQRQQPLQGSAPETPHSDLIQRERSRRRDEDWLGGDRWPDCSCCGVPMKYGHITVVCDGNGSSKFEGKLFCSDRCLRRALEGLADDDDDALRKAVERLEDAQDEVKQLRLWQDTVDDHMRKLRDVFAGLRPMIEPGAKVAGQLLLRQIEAAQTMLNRPRPEEFILRKR